MKTLTALILLIASFSAFAAAPCAKVSTTLTPAQRKIYTRSISSNLTKWQPPAQIKIEKALTLENWTAVWATPPNAEQGIFFTPRRRAA